MSSNKNLIYSTTGHHIAANEGMTDIVFARSLYSGHPVRQEQLVRIAVAMTEMNSLPVEHPIMGVDKNNAINDLYQDVIELQGTSLDKDLTHAKIGRKAFAVANLFTGSYDQDGFEIIMREPFQNASVLDLLNNNTSKLTTPEFFTKRIRVR